jgi:GNAT superfamily N-acetyltransferase
VRWFPAYSPDKNPALGGHAVLVGLFNGSVAAVALAQRRSGRPLPDRFPASDLVLLSIGTYKLSRLIAKDRIMAFMRAPFTRLEGESDRPGEVSEEPRGEGLQHAIGELLVCPFCLGQWVGTALLATYLRDATLARTIAAAFTIVAGSDLLQEAWVAVDKRA